MKYVNDADYLNELIGNAPFSEFDSRLRGHQYVCENVRYLGEPIILTYFRYNPVDFTTLWRVGNMVFSCEAFLFHEMEEVIATFLRAGNNFVTIHNRNWY